MYCQKHVESKQSSATSATVKSFRQHQVAPRKSSHNSNCPSSVLVSLARSWDVEAVAKVGHVKKLEHSGERAQEEQRG